MTEVKQKNDDTPVPFDEALAKTGNGVYNAALVCTCALILLAIGADLFGFTLVVTAAACDLNITITEKGILTSLPFIGILLVSYFWGYVSDTQGRRFTLVVSMQVGFLLSSLSSLSPNWLVLACVKFFSVCFSCASNSAAYTLVGESCTPRMRNKYMLLMTCLLLFSPAAAAMLTYPTLKLVFAAPIPWLGIVFRPWRLLCIVLAIPSGLGAMAIYFFHESPKFLANQGRDKEALDVLRSIYAVNNRCMKEEFKVSSLQLSEQRIRPVGESLLRSMWEQSAPLFRPPLLKRTVQLFYIMAVVYITNNSFLVWLPHIMNELRLALLKNDGNAGNLCALITAPPPQPVGNDTFVSFANSTEVPVRCHDTVEDNSIFTLIVSQAIFSFFNFIISYLPNKRKAVLITVLFLSGVSGILVNLMPEPISSVIFFMIFTCTCLGMGILASYFVDFYPTSYRGMVACLSIMVGRSSTFVGINLVGQLLFHHCTMTFYFWSILVFTSVAAAWFLPPDKPPEEAITNL